MKKGETLIDTAMTLNAMHPDLLVVRHPSSGAVNLLASKVNCAVLNAGDGRHEHPTQALLDALTIRRRKGTLTRLTVAICGDIAHSRVARSNILLLGRMENRIRLIGPPTLMPAGAERMGAEVFQDLREGLAGADVVMMLRLQRERMDGALVPSMREYYHRFGLDAEKLAAAKPDAIVMHPGPMNRGVEIDGTLADDINVSVIQEQVEMGVAVRMAAMDLLARNQRARNEPAGAAGMLTLANARLVDPEGDRVVAGGAGHRRRADRRGLRRTSRPGADCGGRYPRARPHRHRRQGRRARRAAQGELPHRRRGGRGGRRHHDGHPARHPARDRQPGGARVPAAPGGRGEPGARAADGGADQGPRGPRDDRDRLPDGCRARSPSPTPGRWRDARVFQRCLTYAAGSGALVVGHPQEPALSEGACMTTGQFASTLGLPDVSPVAERIGAGARPRARRGDRRALPRRPDLDGARACRRCGAPRRRACRSRPAPRSTT